MSTSSRPTWEGAIVLKVEGLQVQYGGVRAVQGIDLQVKQGSITAIIGANGAGKSSTLLAIAGMITPSAGHIALRGRNTTGWPSYKLLADGLALIPEGGRIFRRLTVENNLRLGAYLLRSSEEYLSRLEEVYALFPRLAERRGQLGGTLSGGERQMLAIGRALMSKPSILLVDEPSLGLAPVIVDSVFEMLSRLREHGTTLLLVEQNVGLALKLADYAYILRTGRIALEGAAEKLAGMDEIRQAYLGL